jgi:Skp family chaperone for outer membrane proteins
MRKLVPGLLLLGLMSGSALAQTRVATVNLQKAFDRYWRTEQVIAALKDRVAELAKTHDEMVRDYKKSKEEYQKLLEDANNQAVSPEERDRRKSAAEDKLKDLKSMEDNITQFDHQADVSVAEQKARMRKNLLDEIKLAIDSKAKAGGYALVIDTGAQTYAADPSGPYYTPNVLYWNETNDLTDTVISQLNAGAPLEAPKVQAKPVEPKGKK